VGWTKKGFPRCGKLFFRLIRTLLGALAPRVSFRYFAGSENYKLRCSAAEPDELQARPVIVTEQKRLNDFCHNTHVSLRGPRSTWFQSMGTPVRGSTGLPPPHRSPLLTAILPNMRFIAGVVIPEIVTSAPIAGQVVWVERSIGAAGRPRRLSPTCSASVRKPESSPISVPVSCRQSRNTFTRASARRLSIFHTCCMSQE